MSAFYFTNVVEGIPCTNMGEKAGYYPHGSTFFLKPEIKGTDWKICQCK